MNIIRPEQGETTKKNQALVAKKLLTKPEVEVVRIEIAAGGSLPSHSTPVEVFFYVIAGEGEIEIGEERERVSAGMLVESPKDIPHALYNPSSRPFAVLVVKTPKPGQP